MYEKSFTINLQSTKTQQKGAGQGVPAKALFAALLAGVGSAHGLNLLIFIV